LDEVVIANDRHLTEESGQGRRTATHTPLGRLGLMVPVDAIDVMLEKRREENATRGKERVAEHQFELER
jgi:hypothetical protein